MARKNMGKVKHYNHSFYTGGQRIKRFAGTLALLAALFFAGWLVGPAVIDFGTSTWYKLKHKIEDKPQQTQSQAVLPAESQPQQPEPESQAQPQATPEPVKTNPGEGKWSFVSVTAVKDAHQAEETAKQLASQGVKYAVVTFKDDQGHVYYNSSVELAKAAASSTVFDPAATAKALKAQGIVPVAAVAAFKDPIAAGTERTMAVKYQNEDFLWLDAARDQGGKPWLNPASPAAVQYIADIIAEAKGFGFEEIWLTNLQFPTESGRSKANFGDMGGRSMAGVLKDALQMFNSQAPCWVEYSLEKVSMGAANPLIGGNPADLGVERLVLHTDEAPDPEMLAAVVNAAKAGGVETVALTQGMAFSLQ